jgi:hypothetical protein
MAEIHIGSEGEFSDRDRKVIVEDELEIGVFFVDGEF